MSFSEVLMFFAAIGAALSGVYIGRRQRKHRHTWTMWTRVWDDDKQVLTEIQERSCTGCGLHEKHDPAPACCPPHQWGKWFEVPLKNKGMGQQRDCDVCGVAQLRTIGSANEGINLQ